MGVLYDVFREIVIRIPFTFRYKSKVLSQKLLSSVKTKGSNITILNNCNIKRKVGLVFGNNILIGGNNKMDASAGILIGDNVKISKNISISTFNKSASIRYNPIIIGSGNDVNENIEPGTIIKNKFKVKGLNSFDGQVVFVVSTGRSGSKAIADILGQHQDVDSYHDAFAHINSYASEFLYKRSDGESIKKKLDYLYNSFEIKKSKIHLQSDHKLSAIIPLLSDLFPQSKFIWLIRDGHSFVNSSYSRGWFRNSEFGYEDNPNEFFENQVTPGEFHAYHRLNGFLVQSYDLIKWKKMTAFERNCWYWAYWNNMIEKQLKELKKGRWLMIKLSEIENQRANIGAFIGANLEMVRFAKSNKAYYKKLEYENWNAEMISIYKEHCSNLMEKWFHD